jgi:hypothetical protein
MLLNNNVVKSAKANIYNWCVISYSQIIWNSMYSNISIVMSVRANIYCSFVKFRY